MENRRSMTLDFSKIHTYSAENRHNLVRIDNLKRPGQYQPGEWGSADFDALIGQLRRARAEGRQIILSMGAHVVKCGLSPYLIALMREGYITHIAGNGACSIHDFELAYLGGTSEDVPTAIEDGSFGMWEQTGAWMNEAIQRGAAANIGYGEALARYIDGHPDRFPYKDDCVLYQAYRMDIPATYHIALGTDIIHQHPSVDFAAIGKASGIDFHKMCYSVAHLDKGVYMNFGSGVIGRIPQDDAISRAELTRRTVIESAPDAPSAAAFAGLARFMLSSEAGAVPLPMDAEALEAVGDEIARRRMGAMQP